VIDIESNLTVIDVIQPGDRVTIVTQHGSLVTGTARIPNGERWVLDLGGRHGQPGIAKVENICQVARRCGRRWVSVFPGSPPFLDANQD
jgi:hypothetical protein